MNSTALTIHCWNRQ